eukprot:PhF_6_TR22210/c0_g1_i1/m.31358
MDILRIQETPHAVYYIRADPLDPGNPHSPHLNDYFVATSHDSYAEALLFACHELNTPTIDSRTISWHKRYMASFGPLSLEAFVALVRDHGPTPSRKLFTKESAARSANLGFPSPLKSVSTNAGAVSKSELFSKHEYSSVNHGMVGGNNNQNLSTECRKHHEELESMERATLMLKLQTALRAAEEDRKTYEDQYMKEKAAVQALEAKFLALVQKQTSEAKDLREKVAKLEAAVQHHEADKASWQTREREFIREIESLTKAKGESEKAMVMFEKNVQKQREQWDANAQQWQAALAAKDAEHAKKTEEAMVIVTQLRRDIEVKSRETKDTSEEKCAKVREEYSRKVDRLMEDKLELAESLRREQTCIVELRNENEKMREMIVQLRRGLMGVIDTKERTRTPSYVNYGN